MSVVMCFGAREWHHTVSEFKNDAILGGAKILIPLIIPLWMLLPKASEYTYSNVNGKQLQSTTIHSYSTKVYYKSMA